jgi:hypothetical protein
LSIRIKNDRIRTMLAPCASSKTLKVVAYLSLATFFAGLVLFVCLDIALFAKMRLDPESAQPSSAVNRDTYDLREIGRAVLIYATDHDDKLPRADTIWDYAARLSKNGVLHESQHWLTSNLRRSHGMPVLLSEPKSPGRINPKFLAQTPTIAAASGKLTRDMPSSTPVAWTAGLKPDGYWSTASAYGGDGGLICFLDGNVHRYTNLYDNGGTLVHFVTRQKTSNILDALPPGTIILEAPQTTLPDALKRQRFLARARGFIGLGWEVWMILVIIPVNFLLLRASGLHQRRMPKWLLLAPTGWALCLILAMVVVRHL